MKYVLHITLNTSHPQEADSQIKELQTSLEETAKFLGIEIKESHIERDRKTRKHEPGL